MKTITKFVLGCSVVLLAAWAQPVAAQWYGVPRVHQAYRVSYKTEYDIREVTAYRIEYETEYRDETVVTYKPQVFEELRERHYTVQKPVEQISYRTTYRTVWKPRTSYRTRYVDRGGWVDQQSIVRGWKYPRLAWQPGRQVVNPNTGVTMYYRGGLSWATVQNPDRVVVHRVWKPNVVAEEVPYTTYVAETVEEQTPVTTYKMITEHRVEKIPVRVTKMIRVEEVRKVPYRVRKRVPFVYQQRIPRLVTYYTPIDACGNPIVVSAGPLRIERPFADLAGFFAQPRLVLAWLQALGRVMFWACFVIYTPLYAIETGLGREVGGLLISLGSGFMLLMPLWGWTARRFGIRRVSLIGFPVAAASMAAAGLLSAWPWLGALFLVCGACAMSAVDGYGNALFFRACKPSQRTAMTPIFSAQRDLASIGHAGIFAVLLSFFPIQAVYITLGLVLFGLTLLATRINRRL